MGQHRIPGGSINKRPNPEKSTRRQEPLECLVCGGPTALFQLLDVKDEQGKDVKRRVRLAKTVVRVTERTRDTPRIHVHEQPCLRQLIQDWAKYTMKHDRLKSIGQGLTLDE